MVTNPTKTETRAADESRRSSLARLLSTENISVQHARLETAYFDVKNRILGLPIWENTSKDVYDMLVGHEVGHALFTPSWDPAKFGCPHMLVNITEDIRIERMIQDKYPGLVACFRRAYTELVAKDFFGVAKMDLAKLNLADRINLKAKGRDGFAITFSAEEQVVVDQCFAATTFQEAIAAANSLHKFMQQNAQPEQPVQSQNVSGQGEVSGMPESLMMDTSLEQDDSTVQSQTDTKVTGKNSAGADTSSKADTAGDKPESAGNSGEGTGTPAGQNAEPKTDEPITQKNFESNAAKLATNQVDTYYNSFVHVADITSAEANAAVIPFNTISAARARLTDYPESYTAQKNLFFAQTKRHTAMLAKEFELRKAAYQSAKSVTSRTGDLDPSRMASYKTSEDIFLSSIKLANAKNHGMMMFVDYSGSMRSVLGDVLKHLINLCSFCKAVGIPFQVYAFTEHLQGSKHRREVSNMHPAINKVDITSLGLRDICNSSLSKTDYNTAIGDMYRRSVNAFNSDGYSGEYDRLNNTPLNETILCAHKLVAEFKAKHRVEKMNVIFLADGGGHLLSTRQHASFASLEKDKTGKLLGSPDGAGGLCTHHSISGTIQGRKIKFTNAKSDSKDSVTCVLLENLGITTGSNIIGFFIPESNYRAVSRFIDYSTSYVVRNQQIKDLKSKYRRNKFLSGKNMLGYNEYLVVASGKDLATEEETLSVNVDVSRRQIADAFTSYSESKKVNRVFVTTFAKIVS